MPYNKGTLDAYRKIKTYELEARNLNLTGSANVGGNLVVTGSISGSSYIGISGSGDMSKSTYDTDNDGIVDNSELVEGLTVSQVRTHAPASHGDSHTSGSGDAVTIYKSQISDIDAHTVIGPQLIITGSTVSSISGSLIVTGSISGSSYQGSVVTSVRKSGSSGLTADVHLTGSGAVYLTQTGQVIEISGSQAAAGVSGIAKTGSSLMTGNVYLVEGSNVTITQGTQALTIAASLAGGGDVSGSSLTINGPAHITGSTEFDQTVGRIKSGSYYGGAETASYIIWNGSEAGGPYFAKDGSTGKIFTSGSDASTVIQAAITALPDGGTIYFKKGTYEITGIITIPDKIELIGEGGGTMLNMGATIFSIQDDSSYLHLLNTRAVHIKGIFFSGTWDTGKQYAVVIEDSGTNINNVVLERCGFYGFIKAVYFKNAFGSSIGGKFVSCTFQMPSAVTAYCLYAEDISHFTFDTCHFLANNIADSACLYFSVAPTETYPHTERLTFINCGWNGGANSKAMVVDTERIDVTCQAEGYINCVASDIGKTVTDDDADIGTLLGYNNTTRIWYIKGTVTPEIGSVMAITGGNGAGISSSANMRGECDCINIVGGNIENFGTAIHIVTAGARALLNLYGVTFFSNTICLLTNAGMTSSTVISVHNCYQFAPVTINSGILQVVGGVDSVKTVNSGTTTITGLSGSVAHELYTGSSSPPKVRLTLTGSATFDPNTAGPVVTYPSGSANNWTGFWVRQTGSGTIGFDWEAEI